MSEIAKAYGESDAGVDALKTRGQYLTKMTDEDEEKEEEEDETGKEGTLIDSSERRGETADVVKG